MTTTTPRTPAANTPRLLQHPPTQAQISTPPRRDRPHCRVANKATGPGLLLFSVAKPEAGARASRLSARTRRPVLRESRSERRAPLVDPRVVDFSLGMEQRICEFGFPGPLRDRLVDAVLSGVKTATSSLLVDWQRDGEQPPAAGELQTVIDSAGTPVAIIEILGSEVVALGAVDDRVARAEGESYQTAAGWRSAHERFLARGGLPRLGGGGTGPRRLNSRRRGVVPSSRASLTPPLSPLQRREHRCCFSRSPSRSGSPRMYWPAVTRLVVRDWGAHAGGVG
jgi:uncharacterized protein YhfF